MKWEAHQGLGFIGLAPTKNGEEPRLVLSKYGYERLNPEDVSAVSSRYLGLWIDARKHPDAPPFSGGVLDAWPAWAVDALAICRDEEKWIELALTAQEKGAARG